MSITNTDTDRFSRPDFKRLATIYAAVHLAVAVWVIYLDLLAFRNGAPYPFSLSFGLESAVEPLLQGLLVGFVLAPIAVTVLWICTRFLPIREVVAQTIVPWVVLCLGGLASITGLLIHWTNPTGFWFMIDADPWPYIEGAAMWVTLTTLFVAFVGGAFALATQYPTLSRRATHATVAVVVLVAAIPAGMVVAGPSEQIQTPDYSEPTYEQLTDPSVYQGPGPNPDYEEHDLQTVPAADTNADDWGDHHLFTGEPYFEPGEPYFGPSPQVPYNITETHTGTEYFDAADLAVQTDGGNVTVEGHYYLRFSPPVDTVRGDDPIIINSGTHLSSTVNDGWSTTREVPDGELSGLVDEVEGVLHFHNAFNLVDEVEGVVKMENAESMWVYYDIYHDNGEIHRYQVYLERTDV